MHTIACRCPKTDLRIMGNHKQVSAPRRTSRHPTSSGVLFMAIFKRASSQALVLAGVMLAGCAMEGGDGIFTTGSLTGNQQAAADAKADPACVTLASRIEALRKDGIPDKIE